MARNAFYCHSQEESSTGVKWIETREVCNYFTMYNSVVLHPLLKLLMLNVRNLGCLINNSTFFCNNKG